MTYRSREKDDCGRRRLADRPDSLAVDMAGTASSAATADVLPWHGRGIAEEASERAGSSTSAPRPRTRSDAEETVSAKQPVEQDPSALFAAGGVVAVHAFKV